MRSPVALIVFLALAAPPAARADAPGKGDVAALRFAWPATLEARVTSRATRTRTGQPATATTTRWVQRARREGGAFRITMHDVAVEGDAPVPAASADDRKAMVKELAAATEALVQVVDADGEFVALEGDAAVRDALGRMLASAGLPEAQVERARAALETQLRAEAAEAWNLAVGFWTGADLETGARYAMESEGAIPLVPSLTAAYAVEFGARRRVPCTAAAKDARCVELTLRSVPDPEVLPRIVPALVERLAGPGAELPPDAIAELAIENELVLVTEPATLLPHRLVSTKTVRLAGKGGGPGATLEQVDRREYDWRYGAAAKPKAARPAAKKKAG